MAEAIEKAVKKIEPKKVKLTISSTDDDKSDVTLAHNHRHILIKRDEPVIVDECFLEVLKHSVIETTVKDEDGKNRSVKIQRYPFSVEPI